jgi:hypothetical protein
MRNDCNDFYYLQTIKINKQKNLAPVSLLVAGASPFNLSSLSSDLSRFALHRIGTLV